MSANKPSYKKFTKELQKNYERHTKELRKNYSDYKYMFVNKMASSMLVPQESSSAVLVMMSSKSVSICNRSHARRANSGKITFLRVSLFDTIVRGAQNLVTWA